VKYNGTEWFLSKYVATWSKANHRQSISMLLRHFLYELSDLQGLSAGALPMQPFLHVLSNNRRVMTSQGISV